MKIKETLNKWLTAKNIFFAVGIAFLGAAAGMQFIYPPCWDCNLNSNRIPPELWQSVLICLEISTISFTFFWGEVPK
jgi:hypothetical protein